MGVAAADVHKQVDRLPAPRKRFVNIDDAFASAEPVLADDNEEVWSGLDGKVFRDDGPA